MKLALTARHRIRCDGQAPGPLREGCPGFPPDQAGCRRVSRTAAADSPAPLRASRRPGRRLGARVLAEEAGNLAARARLEPAAARQLGPADRFALTPREHEVLGLVCADATNRQIAEQLFISPKTAGLHVSHILAKLGVTTRGEAAALAHRLGHIDDLTRPVSDGHPGRTPYRDRG
jgi:DNA-binding CsgD family transcriptional regulator